MISVLAVPALIASTFYLQVVQIASRLTHVAQHFWAFLVPYLP